MILVTGAGGTVGSAVVKALGDARARYRVAYHSKDKAEKARAAGQDTAVLDFARPETLAPALGGVDKVFLLGATTEDQADRETRVVREAKKAGVEHLVKLSVWEAAKEGYGFARVHRKVEKEIEASGLAWTFLRPNCFMQNAANYLAGTIKSQGAFYQPTGDARVSQVDVRDIAALAAKALTEAGHEGKAYDLSGPNALGWGEVAETIGKAIGKAVKYVPVSDEDGRKGMLAAGIPVFYADLLLDLYRFYRNRGADRVSPAVPQALGRPAISFERYVRDHVELFR